MTRVTDPAKVYSQFTYDAASRVTWLAYGKNGVESTSFNFTYDSVGNMSSFSSATARTTLAYDAKDRLTDVTEPSGEKLHYDFDLGSNRQGSKTTVTVPKIAEWSITNQRDDRGLLSEIADGIYNKTSWYRYNESGRLVKSFNQTNTTGTSTLYDYDAAGRMTQVKVQSPSGWATVLLRYSYDANGNVTQVNDDLNGTYVQYTYDGLDQLMQEQYWTDGRTAADTTIAYSYDAMGNRTSVTRNGAAASYEYNDEKNRLTKVGTTEYRYDDAGRLSREGSRTFTWNDASQLKQLADGTNTYDFTYDALGRRTSKTRNGAVEYYHYDGHRVAYVTNAAGTVLQRFTYDAAGRPVALGQDGTLYYYHYNAHGDVIKMTDLAGNSVADYTYDAWGNILSKTGTIADANPYRYSGYWYDAETALYYLNARYYSPARGRFISPDTNGGLKKAPLTLNRYAYAVNNPVKFVDPTGNFLELAAGLAGGAAAGAFLGVAAAVVVGGVIIGGLVVVGGMIYDQLTATPTTTPSTAPTIQPATPSVTDDVVFEDASSGDAAPATEWAPPTIDEVENQWEEVPDPQNEGDGKTYQNPNTGEKIRFDPKKPGEPGWRGRDHYHRLNPDPITRRKFPYLDKFGKPVPRGPNRSHIPAPPRNIILPPN